MLPLKAVYEQMRRAYRHHGAYGELWKCSNGMVLAGALEDVENFSEDEVRSYWKGSGKELCLRGVMMFQLHWPRTILPIGHEWYSSVDWLRCIAQWNGLMCTPDKLPL